MSLPEPAAARQIRANGLWLLLAYVAPRLGQWIAVLFVARVVGAERFGWYGTAASLAVILSVATTLGLMPLLIRDLAREPSRAPAVLRAAHRLKTWTNLAMLALLGALVWGLGYSGTVAAATLVLGLGYAIGSYAENLGAYFQAIERMRVWMQANAVLGLVAGLTGVVLVAATGSIVAFCAAAVLGQVAALAWLARQARMPPGDRRTVAAGSLVRGAAPFAAAFILLTIFYKVDVLLVEAFRGATEVGIYTAAYKFIDVIHALTLVGVGAMYPRLSRLLREGKGARGSETGGRLMELSVLATVVPAAVLSLGASAIVGAAFGSEYGAAADVLALLALAVPFLSLNLFAAHLLGARSRMHWVAVAYGVGLLVKVTIDLGAIERWGAGGAAAGMVSAEVVTASVLIGVLAVKDGVRLRMRAVMLPAGALVGAASLVNAGVQGVGVAFFFIVALTVLYRLAGALTFDERRLLKYALTARLASASGNASPEAAP